jgi:hypothetical protein
METWITETNDQGRTPEPPEVAGARGATRPGSDPNATANAARARPASESPGADGWISLFNGQDLDGWVQHDGRAEYRVADGAIVGKTVPRTPNSFLCTTREFEDFILELEFRVDPGLNSGIQFRSQVFDQPTTVEVNGRQRTIAAGRVHGYQYEIDPSARAWTGGIYDEGRRGWLQDLKEKPAARQAFRQNAWNQVRIEARGDSLRTWINGVPAAEIRDGMTRRGFIALQVHGVGSRTEPLEVRWRSIRLKTLDGR